MFHIPLLFHLHFMKVWIRKDDKKSRIRPKSGLDPAGSKTASLLTSSGPDPPPASRLLGFCAQRRAVLSAGLEPPGVVVGVAGGKSGSRLRLVVSPTRGSAPSRNQHITCTIGQATQQPLFCRNCSRSCDPHHVDWRSELGS